MNVAKEKLKSVESEHGRQVHLRRLINSCVLQGGGEGEVDKSFQAYSPETKTTEADVDQTLDANVDAVDPLNLKQYDFEANTN